uniref:Agglutinin C-terminal domain-containing protein n=1 Tax=viral metagenome TaxID=1070528 RepID=A0A6M3J0H1_9ZZZZ
MNIGTFFCSLGKALGGCDCEEPEMIQPCGTIDIHTASSILLDKMEEMDAGNAEIYLPDENFKVYNKDVVKAFLKLDEIDKIPYVTEVHDCDDFSAELFGLFAGLVWTNAHALNFFIDENETLWFVEPQSDEIAPDLEDWQGWRIRFFIGR